MELSYDDLAAVPRWSDRRTADLPGHCRGDLLGPWAENLRRRFGDEALARVNARLPAPLRQVTAAPTSKQWLPVEAQVRVTEAIVDEVLEGDALALYPIVVDDARRSSGRASLVALRALGPRRLFKLAPRAHRKVYDVGAATVDTERKSAHLEFSGAALFGHPTWRLLQVFATRTALELQGTAAEVTAEDRGDHRFALKVRWI